MLQALALVNYGHFTSMQVRDGAVQGLDLHLQRLAEGNRALFDAPLDAPRLRAWMRLALAEAPDASLRVTLFSRDFDHRQPQRPCLPDVLVSVAPPARPGQGAVRLRAFAFQRPLPSLKHVATLPLFYYRRQARLGGDDDALFIAPGDGRVSEGSVWNLACWDGKQVLWPQADALRGTCESLVRRGLAQIGVRQCEQVLSLAQVQDLPAITLNATGLQPVASIDGVASPAAGDLQSLALRALDTQPWVPI
jgi:branched-subunit amino acid aminotransferase/4-amino-4-deoxychorismate lyase